MPSIAELLFDAEKGQIHIPDFQRPWVWNKNQVRDLFTSLYRRYPVGAMVFWPNRSNGVQRHSLIDGRQRLTALYHVIRGQQPPWMRETPTEFAQPLGFNVVDECVASDFARQILSFFKQHWAGFAVSVKEAAGDEPAGPKDQEEEPDDRIKIAG